MESLLRDLRQAARVFRQRPVFSAIAALSLAIGIGASTTIFSVIDRLFLTPPVGVAEPDRVVEIGRTVGGRGFDTFGYPELQAMGTDLPAFEHVAGWVGAPMSLSLGDVSRRVMGFLVSHSYFDVMGLAPAQGRFFTGVEDRVGGAEPVAVVTDHFWRRQLGADPAAVGRTIDLNRRIFTVIGVLPPGFTGHFAGVRMDVLIPITQMGVVRQGFDDWNRPGSAWLLTVGRLAPGATMEEANTALATLFSRRVEPGTDAVNAWGARVEPLGAIPTAGRGPARAFLAVLMGLVGLVLLATCINVAGMLLARATAREQDIAVRLAIGAPRRALIRQLVLESATLFGVGGLGGIGLALGATRLLSLVRIPAPIPIELNLRPDLGVLALGLAVALITGLVFGLAPAWQVTRPDILGTLRRRGVWRTGGAGRLRRVLVAGQVGLSLALLLTAGLFLRSLDRAAGIDPGFTARGVSMLSFDLEMDGYDAARGAAFQRAVLDRLRAEPGIEAAGYADDLPLDMSISETPTWPEGWAGGDRDYLNTVFTVASDGYFETVAVRLLSGRFFTPADRAETQPVAVVSRAYAERVWPGEPAVGKRLRFGGPEEPWRTVVGVAGDVKPQTLSGEAGPTIYLPLTQQYQPRENLLVRGGTAPQIERIIRGLDPRLSHPPVQPLEAFTALGIMPQRIGAMAGTALGSLALLLAALGIYGVVAFTVAQRQREMGIRMALGATRRSVSGMVLAGALRLAAPGVLLGLAGGAGLGFVVRGFILGVAPLDPVAFGGVALVVLTMVFAAGWAPARRAAGVEPMDALRAE
jgi:predicted permease